MKLNSLLTYTTWVVLAGSSRDAPTSYNFLKYGSIVFVSLELPGEGSVSRRNSRLSQPETVSTLETVGILVSQPRVSAFGDAAAGLQRYRRIHRSYASHRRTVCLRSARNGRVQ